MVDALHLAGEDERVQGLVAIIGEGETPTDLHRSKSCRMLFCISGDLPRAFAACLCHAMVVQA